MFLLPRNHPGLASSLIDLLRAYGGHSEHQLRALLIPPNLWRGDEPEGQSKTPAAVGSFNDTLKALLDAGALKHADGHVQLTRPFATHLGSAAVADRLALWLLDEERTGTDPCSSEGAQGATGDLAHSLTWFLQLDPLGPWTQVSARSAELSPVARLQEETGRSLPADTFKNPSDWSLFVRWSTYLGFGELRPGGRLDPDPTVAIGRVLDEVLPEEMSLSTFLGGLGASVPMFGGHLERSWHGSTTPTLQGTVPPSLANALLRLEHAGCLRLDTGVDEDDIVVLEFGRFAPVEGPEGVIRPTQRRYARVRPEVAA